MTNIGLINMTSCALMLYALEMVMVNLSKYVELALQPLKTNL